MSGTLPLEADLAHTLREIGTLVAGTAAPPRATLQRVAFLLEGFVARHREALDFEAFPLPTDGAVLCSYDLTEPGTTPVLRANALAAGATSGIHDHGTWAVIVAVQGRECHRVHRRTGDSMQRVGEHWVEPGQPLVLSPSDFHAIQTPAPVLQLHLYGSDPDSAPRHAWDPHRQQLRPLG